MVAPLLASQTGRAMTGLAATARPSGTDDTGFAAMLSASRGAAAKGTISTEAAKGAALDGPPTLEGLHGELEGIVQNGLAQLVAAGTDATAQAAAVSDMDAGLREAVAGFDDAHGTDLSGLLNAAPGAAMPFEAEALGMPVARVAVQAVTSSTVPVGAAVSLRKIFDLLSIVAMAAQGHAPTETPVAGPARPSATANNLAAVAVSAPAKAAAPGQTALSSNTAVPSPPGRSAGEATAASLTPPFPEAESATAEAGAAFQAAPDAATGEEKTRTPPSFAALSSEAAAQGGKSGAQVGSPEPPVREILVSETGAAPPRAAETAAVSRIAPAPPPPPSGFSRALNAQIRETSVVEGRTRIALTPGGLGEIEIELSRDAGQLKVVIRAENQTVLQALRGDRDGLMTMLGNSGSDVEDGQLSFESFDRGNRDGTQSYERAAQRPNTDPAAGPETTPAANASASPSGDGQLDILT